LKIIKKVGLIIGLFVVLIGCDEKPKEIGLDLVDDQKLFVGWDTNNVVTGWSLLEDSVLTSLSTKPYDLLGSYYNPVYGISTAGFYTHIRIPTNSPDFGNEPQADSVFLTLVYTGYYGNKDTEQSVYVHQVDSAFYKDSLYYSNQTVAINPDILGSLTFVPNPNDSVLIDSVPYPAELRIPLDNDFGDMILTADAENLVDNDAFLNFVKGIHVTADDVYAPGEGAILYFDLKNTRSNITIHYHTDTLQEQAYSLVINQNSARFNNYAHNYEVSSDPLFKQQVLEGDSLLGTNKLYLQSMGGVKTNLYFPGLLEWLDGKKIAVNQAKLILPIAPSAIAEKPPVMLSMFQYDEEGMISELEDNAQSDQGYFGGAYNESKQEYFFRITFYVQSLLKGEPDYGLSLMVSGKTYTAYNTVLYGTENQMGRIRLEIIYTDLN